MGSLILFIAGRWRATPCPSPSWFTAKARGPCFVFFLLYKLAVSIRVYFFAKKKTPLRVLKTKEKSLIED